MRVLLIRNAAWHFASKAGAKASVIGLGFATGVVVLGVKTVGLDIMGCS